MKLEGTIYYQGERLSNDNWRTDDDYWAITRTLTRLKNMSKDGSSGVICDSLWETFIGDYKTTSFRIFRTKPLEISKLGLQIYEGLISFHEHKFDYDINGYQGEKKGKKTIIEMYVLGRFINRL